MVVCTSTLAGDPCSLCTPHQMDTERNAASNLVTSNSWQDFVMALVEKSASISRDETQGRLVTPAEQDCLINRACFVSNECQQD